MNIEHLTNDLLKLKDMSKFDQMSLLQEAIPKLISYKTQVDKSVVEYLTRAARPNLPIGDYRKEF